ncbi:alpha/beta hydrolase [Cupriavidus sp. YAF13]|uniref:alpha/beta hydrolase n=1 Tax=Cupriavidus sp. YAF13 TaxID=3233075 RepID=UPI003F8EEAD7
MSVHTDVTFDSDGLRLAGSLHLPPNLAGGERRPAIAVLHGFGSNKDDGMVQLATRLFSSLGYVVLRFDMRGCGNSEGERGKVLCEDQVRDTRNAVSYLQSLSEVEPAKIAVMGHSFGAAVAVYAAGVDPRIGACISSAGWGDGEVKLRQQHAGPGEWQRFEAMVEEGRARLAMGQSMQVSRFDIVPIPPAMRSNLPAGSFMAFPFEVVESMLGFRPNAVVGDIAPRPLLLLHPADDSVTPTDQSIELFRNARMPAELHLLSEIDHFIFSDDNRAVLNLVTDWLVKFFPVRQAPSGAA